MEINHDSECFHKTASLMEIQHGWNIFQMNLPETSIEKSRLVGDVPASHLWLRKHVSVAPEVTFSVAGGLSYDAGTVLWTPRTIPGGSNGKILYFYGPPFSMAMLNNPEVF